MPITKLKEPIWEKQDGETPNQYDYFLEFLKFPTYNLKDYHTHLCELHQNSQKFTNKKKITSYDVIRKWAGDSCNKWKERKIAKRKADNDDIQETLHELDKEDAIEEYQTKKRIIKELLNRIECEVDTQPMSQLAQGVDGYRKLKDDNRIDKGEATEVTNTKIDADVAAEVKQEITTAENKEKQLKELRERMEQMTYD